jgi:hypothetical protein
MFEKVKDEFPVEPLSIPEFPLSLARMAWEAAKVDVAPAVESAEPWLAAEQVVKLTSVRWMVAFPVDAR